MTTTTLNWHKKNNLPTHDCSVIVLCEWNFGGRKHTIFQVEAREGQQVSFNNHRIIAWAEINMEEIELGILNKNFDVNFVNFLHNNIKNI